MICPDCGRKMGIVGLPSGAYQDVHYACYCRGERRVHLLRTLEALRDAEGSRAESRANAEAYRKLGIK